MRKFLTFMFILSSIWTRENMQAESFTADDFVGENKFCTQLFYGTEMVDERVQESAWGRFERVDGYDNKIRLTSFKNGGAVTFTIDGDKLILDGTETKDGTATTDKEGNSIRLRTVTHHTKNISNTTCHYFLDNPKVYSGQISLDKNHNIVITFFDQYLSFRGRSSDDVNVWAYDSFKKDFLNTFKKCELYVSPVNGHADSNTANDRIPLYILPINSDNDDYILGIQNFGGTGINFEYPTQSSCNILGDGISININRSYNTFHLDKQIFSARIEPELDGRFIPSGIPIINSGKGTLGVWVKEMKVGNYWVEDSDGGDIVGQYSVTGHTVTPGWHKKYGGNFEVLENIRCSADWTTYYLGPDNKRTELYPLASHNIYLSLDATPDVTVIVGTCIYNSEGIYVKGYLKDEINPEIVDSYDVFMIPNRKTDILDEGFDAIYPYGHEKAILVYGGAGNSLQCGGDLSFEQFISAEECEAKGWNPTRLTEDEPGISYVTIYVRFNLKDNVVAHTLAREADEKQSDRMLYAFGGLTPAPQTLTTCVGSVESAPAEISATDGVISVYGASAPVQIYDASGMLVYNGKDGDIATGNGLFIVRTGATTRKIHVK